MSDLRHHLNLISEAAGPAAPEVGALFAYHGEIFAVVGWMREIDVPGSFEKGKQRLIACDKTDATWVIGKGLNAPSTLARVSAIQVTGDAGWSAEQYESVHASISNAIQKGATITVPAAHANLK